MLNEQKKLIIDSNSIPYLNFNRYPNQRNWGFYTTQTDTKTFEKLWTDGLNSWNMALPTELKNAYGVNGTMLCYDQGNELSDRSVHSWYVTFNMANKFAYRGRTDEGFGPRSTRARYFIWPGCGFEDNYITNWNQLYTTYFDTVAKDTDLADKSAFLIDDQGNYHVGLKNGVPIVKIDTSESKVTFDIELKNNQYDISNGNKTSSIPTTDCYVWFSDEPFIGWPNDQECLDFNPLDSSCEKGTDTNFNKAVKIPASKAGRAKVEISAPNGKKYLWAKWSTNGEYGGGTLVIPEKVTIETEG